LGKENFISEPLNIYHINPPIKIDNKIAGVVSFGQDIEILIKRFKILGAKKISILLNNKLIKYSLLPKFYNKSAKIKKRTK
jgi:two-component system cell cycle response regulator